MGLSTGRSLLGALALALGVVGCTKEKPPDATQSLQQSFQTAQPQVKNAIEAVNSSLKAGNYTEATRALEPIVTAQRLTDQQKQAVSIALQQINQALVKDPTLDTKEMYEKRAKMFEALHRGPRF